MEAYFDNSATTRVFDSVKDIVVKTMTEDYGNAAAKHTKGVEAERYIREARSIIAKSLKVEEKEIVFTSGGSESNNMALIGAAMANQRGGKHIITTNVEHSSVYNTLGFLQDQGFDITYLPVDSNGHISISQLRESLRPETILVSVMYVNNEVGSVEPIEDIGKVIKEEQPQALFHVDAIQAYGKYKIYPQKLGIDFLSVSGHKINGPKGVGFLYVREKTKLSPVLFGGGQQKGIRSGTENVPGIAALGEAASLAYQDLEKNASHLRFLRERLIQEVKKIEGVTVTGESGERFAPHIVSVSVEGVRSEVLLHALEERGVYVSAGSACSSNKPSVSRTLLAIGLKQELLPSTVRFSFCAETTEEEILYAAGCLRELVPFLRKFTRK